MKDSRSRQFAIFLLAGGVAAAMNIGSRIMFSWAGISLGYAIVLAYLVGMTVAFALTRHYVFERSGRAPQHEYVRFALVNAGALAQVWLVTIGLSRVVFPRIGWTFMSDTVAHSIGVASPAITSYIAHKYYTFARISDPRTEE